MRKWRDNDLLCIDLRLPRRPPGGGRGEAVTSESDSRAHSSCMISRAKKPRPLPFPSRLSNRERKFGTRPWFFLRHSLRCVLRQEPQHLLPHPLFPNWRRSHLYSTVWSRSWDRDQGQVIVRELVSA